MYREYIHPVILQLREVLKRKLKEKYTLETIKWSYKLNDYAFCYFKNILDTVDAGQQISFIFDGAYKEIQEIWSNIEK